MKTKTLLPLLPIGLFFLAGCTSTPVIQRVGNAAPSHPFYRILVRHLNADDDESRVDVESTFERAIHSGTAAFARTEKGAPPPFGFDGILNVEVSTGESPVYRFEVIDAKTNALAWSGKAPENYRPHAIDIEQLADVLVSELTTSGVLKPKQTIHPVFGGGAPKEGSGSSESDEDSVN
jgi:hypothetical protein